MFQLAPVLSANVYTPVVYNVGLEDTMTFSINGETPLIDGLADTLDFTEVFSTGLLAVATYDTLGFTEVFSSEGSVFTPSKHVSDALTLTEVFGHNVDYNRTVSDTLTFTETFLAWPDVSTGPIPVTGNPTKRYRPYQSG